MDRTKSAADLASELKGMSRLGFNIVKMKVGALTLAEDLKRVQAALNGLDESCKLIIDGVYSYSEDDALKLFSALPVDKIEAFQSPVKAHDIDGMCRLCAAGVPVMGTEAEYREEIHKQLVDRTAVKYLQTAPVACGGITQLLELTELIQSANTAAPRLSLEVSSTAVALLAAFHFSASTKIVEHTEYHFVHQVFFDQLGISPVPESAGWFDLPDKPGLGLTLPMSLVKLEFQISN